MHTVSPAPIRVFFFPDPSLIRAAHVTGCKWQLKNRIRHKNDGASNRSGGCFAPDFLSYGKLKTPSSFHFNRTKKYLHVDSIDEREKSVETSMHHLHNDGVYRLLGTMLLAQCTVPPCRLNANSVGIWETCVVFFVLQSKLQAVSDAKANTKTMIFGFGENIKNNH